ncbi:MAG: AarF/UbiB family protein [Candidatus Omnitrophica bacterium]|nr:AarF/UbiB family protein [Candidatus Omnitrophota bacterium]
MPLPTRLRARLQRYRQIGQIIVKHGFGLILERTYLSRWLRLSTRSRYPSSESAPVRVRQMLEELGPTFVKFGQILSTRPDLIPFPYLQELEKLQDQVTPLPAQKIRQVLTEEFKKDINSLFASFSEEPSASGSIAQVHRATLVDGTPVVLKVRKPEVEKIIETDLQILRDIVGLITRFMKEAELYQPNRLVEEFARTVKKELNLSLEGRRLQRFRENFSADRSVMVPRVYPEFTTSRVLTMEWVDGVKINRIKEIEEMGLDRKKLALIGARATLKQIFVDGFFQADPHPGNLLVTRDGRLCYLDFGIAGQLNESRMAELSLLLRGLLYQEPDNIIRALSALGALDEKVNTQALRKEIEELLEVYYGVSLKEIRIRHLMEAIFEMMRSFRVMIPAEFSLLARALITIEGVGLMLDPEFNLTSELKPVMMEMTEQKLRLSHLLAKAEKQLTNLYFIVRQIPSTAESFLRHIQKGALNLTFEHEGLEELTSSIDKASNRIAFSLIISALLIASSLIVVSGKGQLILGLPALGVFGFAFAAVMGIWLLIGILRAGKL